MSGVVDPQGFRGILDEIHGPVVPDPAPAPAPAPAVSAVSEVVAKLMAPTGAGDLAAYMDSPANPGRTEWGAHVARGLTGLLGNLNLAVVDLVVGLMKLVQARRQSQ